MIKEIITADEVGDVEDIFPELCKPKHKAVPVKHDNVVIGHMIMCPACKCGHMFYNGKQSNNDVAWTFNGDVDKPTFKPSMLLHGSKTWKRCHSFVTDGKIKFLNDCEHKLAGKTVELQEFDNAN